MFFLLTKIPLGIWTCSVDSSLSLHTGTLTVWNLSWVRCFYCLSSALEQGSVKIYFAHTCKLTLTSIWLAITECIAVSILGALVTLVVSSTYILFLNRVVMKTSNPASRRRFGICVSQSIVCNFVNARNLFFMD